MSTQEAPYRVSRRRQLLRWIMRGLFRTLFHILSPVKIIGRQHVPSKGPYLVAMNHVSLYDPPFITAFWPRPLEAMGAAEIWSKPGQSILVRLYGGIQVHRGAYDRQMLSAALAVLQAGYPLLIAPEGGRTHLPGLRQAQPGVAFLVDKASTQASLPIIPVGLVGTTDDYFSKAIHAQRPPLEMHIGKPLYLPALPERSAGRHQALQENADLVMAHIAALLPPAYRGIYAPAAERLSGG